MKIIFKRLLISSVVFAHGMAPLSALGHEPNHKQSPSSCHSKLHSPETSLETPLDESTQPPLTPLSYDEILESVMKEADQNPEISMAPELMAMDQASVVQKHCEQGGVCARGEKPPKTYSLLHRLVLRSANDIWESVKAVRGRHLRANKVALWDFVKNMAIIWPGQIFGALKNGEPLSLETALASPQLVMHQVPVTVLYHTLFMVWTQSDRGAGVTPHVELPKPENAKEFLVAVAKAYTGGEELNKKGLAKFKTETFERFMGFASIIPLEVLHLSLLTSLQVILPPETQRLLYSGTVLTASELPTALADKAIFATLFGFYLALKWSMLSKPLDLRAIPMAREWMSRAYWHAKTEGISPSMASRFNHRLGLTLEMIYRYGNSAVDGVVVIWFFAEGAPLIRRALESLF